VGMSGEGWYLRDGSCDEGRQRRTHGKQHSEHTTQP
jgi:hypothetical protein